MIKQFFYSLLLILFLPLVLIVDAIRSSRAGWKKAVYLLLIFIFFVSMWIGAVLETMTYATSILFSTGLRDSLSEVQVSGTSMLPTIKDGSTVSLHNPKKFGLERSDIVSFLNPETGGLYYLKRIVGLPGEKVLIKNGRVYINGKALFEPYTLNNLPTYGNTFITECEEYTVPDGHFAVFGDNRTVSQDSRVVGFVSTDEIEGVIKSDIKAKSDDSAGDPEINKTLLSEVDFLEALNAVRTKEKLPLLVTHDTLNALSKTRATQIQSHFESWKNNDLSIEELLDNEGYKFNQVHEYVTFGYLTPQDIVNQILDSTKEKNTFLSSEFTEVGIGVTERTVGECTYPIVSIILSWPSIPTYDKAVVTSWSDEIAVTNKILADLQSWVGYPQKDQKKIREAITVVSEENQIARRIHTRMTDREWLTSDDYADIKRYDGLVKQTNALLDELFPNVKGAMIPKNLKRRL